MSRIGNAVVKLPAKVELQVNGDRAVVKGPLGTIDFPVPAGITLTQEGAEVQVKRESDEKIQRGLHGLTRSLLNNHVQGVSNGWVRNLELVGVGYRAALKGNQLVLSLGFSHEINYDLPKGVEAKVEQQTKIELKSIDKQQIGQVAADIRSYRPPEPYKGKGVRYANEVVRRKAGKAGKGGKGGKK